MALADGDSRSRELLGRGEAARIAQTGLAEAAVFLKKIRAYGDSRLFALNLVAEQMAHSVQPLVPQRLMVTGGGADTKESGGSMSLFGQLVGLLLAEKAGLDFSETEELVELEKYAETLAAQEVKEEVST